MLEVFVEVERDDDKKVCYVEKREFKIGSNEFIVAFNKYNELVINAIKMGYSIEEKVDVKHQDEKEISNIKVR